MLKDEVRTRSYYEAIVNNPLLFEDKIVIINNNLIFDQNKNNFNQSIIPGNLHMG